MMFEAIDFLIKIINSKKSMEIVFYSISTFCIIYFLYKEIYLNFYLQIKNEFRKISKIEKLILNLKNIILKKLENIEKIIKDRGNK